MSLYRTMTCLINLHDTQIHPSRSFRVLLMGLLISALCVADVLAQNNGNGQSAANGFINITVSAEIQASIDIETRSNINLGRVSPGQESVIINPREDPGAGLLRVSGSPGMLFRVSFLEQRELVRVGGGRTLMFYYQVSGAEEENQLLSEPISLENRQLRMSDTGEYFFWVGGRLDLDGDIFGQYEGEFTIEIDFI